MASKMAIPFACALVVLFASYGTEGKAIVGINWGRESAQRLLPSQVVDLLLQNGIGNARVYTSQIDILEAFVGSGINLSIGIFYPLQIKSMEEASDWLHDRLQYFISSNIRYVYLGGYVFDGDRAYIVSVLKSLRMIQSVLNEHHFGHQVKTNIVHRRSELKPYKTKPSEAEFHDEIKEEMIEYLHFVQENDVPFVLTLFPVMEATGLEIDDITFAFPDGKSKTVIKDVNGLSYTNVVEWRIDCYLWALSKLNASNVKILVGQIGWPTDGFYGANVTNAERFWKLFLPWVTSNKGTPLRPGVPIDFYATSLTDETQMTLMYSRHWGIYRSNGMPKYKIDLTGRDRDMYPVTAKGIMHMPNRWCLFNGDHSNWGKVDRIYDWTCNHTDCSAREGSCSSLNYVQNVSYAFNMYFQFQFQDEAACNFEGLGVISTEDPSTEDCVFPIEVVKGKQNNYVSPMANFGVHQRPDFALFVFFICVWVSDLY